MRSSGSRPRRGAPRALRITGLAIWLAACARSAPVTTTPPVAPAGGAESPWLGAWPKAGCFQVTREAANKYRFVIDDVEYHSARAPDGGGVGVIVRAVDIGDLEPRPITLPRLRRLEFSAEGRASGAFVIDLFLIDPEGQDYEPRQLTRICNTKPSGH